MSRGPEHLLITTTLCLGVPELQILLTRQLLQTESENQLINEWFQITVTRNKCALITSSGTLCFSDFRIFPILQLQSQWKHYGVLMDPHHY